MSYYKALGLLREPFSSSPDPDFFYHASSHQTALKRLEISIRLRRGLNVIFGDVGTGKTTLSRALLQTFNEEPQFIFHMILDPSYKSEFQFLSNLVRMFGIAPAFRSTLDFKEALKSYLFQKGVNENKTIILLIDEGQKLCTENIEVLRTLLNYETNECKLLQLIIMSQMELLPRILRIRNFCDRIVMKYTLNPFDEEETRPMIAFRLKQAGGANSDGLFTDEAIREIYRYTQGYPRQIASLCHDALETAVMRGYPLTDAKTIRSIVQKRVFS